MSLTVSAQRQDEALAKVRVAIKNLNDLEKKFDSESTASNLSEYRSAFCLADGMLQILKTFHVKSDIEEYILIEHRKKCSVPILTWE